jgi:hypothetical protein
MINFRCSVRSPGILGLVVFGAAAMLSGCGSRPISVDTQSSKATDDVPRQGKQTARFVGVQSCAASNCHGGYRGDGIFTCEYSVWREQDKHAKAYEFLFSDLSVQIAERLWGDTKQAHEAAECLNCHSPQSPLITPAFEGRNEVVELAPLVKPVSTDGVACEACHGSAEKWLTEHVQPGWRESWERKAAIEKKAYGYLNTRDIAERANVCVQCHVGGPGRDVNHDLIAAGHPRLFFELNAFQEMMPVHWREAEERKYHSDAKDPKTRVPRQHAEVAKPEAPVRSHVKIKLWAVGQVVAFDAALAVLEKHTAPPKQHAAQPNGVTPRPADWPELSGYGCFACHHQLAQPDWRQQRGFAGRHPGDWTWSTWQTPMLPKLSSLTKGPDFVTPGSSFQKLSAEMRRPVPDRAVVRGLAQLVRVQLRPWIQSLNNDPTHYTAAKARTWWDSYLGAEQQFGESDWDSATQFYLAISALNQGRLDLEIKAGAPPPKDAEDIERSLDSIFKRLDSPSRYDSPHVGPVSPLDSLRNDVSTIRKSLGSQ